MYSLGIEPSTFCAANAMLYHWATGTHCSSVLIDHRVGFMWLQDWHRVLGVSLNLNALYFIKGAADPVARARHERTSSWQAVEPARSWDTPASPQNRDPSLQGAQWTQKTLAITCGACKIAHSVHLLGKITWRWTRFLELYQSKI